MAEGKNCHWLLTVVNGCEYNDNRKQGKISSRGSTARGISVMPKKLNVTPEGGMTQVTNFLLQRPGWQSGISPGARGHTMLVRGHHFLFQSSNLTIQSFFSFPSGSRVCFFWPTNTNLQIKE